MEASAPLVQSDARRLNVLEDKNRRLKMLLAKSQLYDAALEDILAKTAEACGPAVGRSLVDRAAKQVIKRW
jgi:hypothetical protein